VAHTLREFFEVFDLESPAREQACSYIGNFRHYEAAAAADFLEFEVPRPTPDEIELSKSKTLELIGRHARGGESLISTPLLMHFVAHIDPSRLPHVVSLTDLYREVIASHLTRDQELYHDVIPPSLRGDDGLKRIRTALTRLGLALHAKRVTRFSAADVE
jgi:hypothetical protein